MSEVARLYRYMRLRDTMFEAGAGAATHDGAANQPVMRAVRRLRH